ncbi:MAG: lysylphosphatidylglycerol synthase transmembrane domain-containing protein [Candidatus Promineifilaceae bacterium]|nr:lysylphosphatidylglycerol synthase transmembrane domain-containing protein [Candidatus Promineifilaceae bacterium]
MENSAKTRNSRKIDKLLPWINLVLALLLISLGIWYLSDKVSLQEIFQALSLANMRYVFVGIIIVLLTSLLKTWRWQMMLIAPNGIPRFSPLFWSTMLGQYVNIIVPFFRLGDIARIYALNRSTDIPMARALGTLVLEKVLDLFMLVLTIAIVLPLIILPDFVAEAGSLLWTVPVISLVVLFLFAYKTELITRFLLVVQRRIPIQLAKRVIQWSISGLEGLSALRSKRLSLLLVFSSALILILSLLLPYIILAAFAIPLGIIAAAFIHIVVTIVTTPPSTPGKIGVFNGAAAFALLSLGLEDEAVMIGYSIIFYLVAVLPLIALGIVAAIKTDWRWQRTSDQQLAMLK